MGYHLKTPIPTSRTRTPSFQPVGPKTHTLGLTAQDRGLRFNNPQTGRWVSRDPIGEMGGVNIYVFVGNDGLSSRDHIGLIKNNTSQTIYVKPEKNKNEDDCPYNDEQPNVIAIAPGEEYTGRIDGVRLPNGDVIKLAGPYSYNILHPDVRADGSLDYVGIDSIEAAINEVGGGGELETSPDAGWTALFAPPADPDDASKPGCECN